MKILKFDRDYRSIKLYQCAWHFLQIRSAVSAPPKLVCTWYQACDQMTCFNETPSSSSLNDPASCEFTAVAYILRRRRFSLSSKRLSCTRPKVTAKYDDPQIRQKVGTKLCSCVKYYTPRVNYCSDWMCWVLTESVCSPSDCVNYGVFTFLDADLEYL